MNDPGGFSEVDMRGQFPSDLFPVVSTMLLTVLQRYEKRHRVRTDSQARDAVAPTRPLDALWTLR